MKLNDLKGVIDFTFDLTDNEVCGRFYIELDEINPKYAKQIEVVTIGTDYVTCKLTDFLRHHKTAIKRHLLDTYNPSPNRDYMINTLTNSDNITEDGGEAVFCFIEVDMYDFLTQQ